MRRILLTANLLLLTVGVAACDPRSNADINASRSAVAESAEAAEWPTLVVHKNESCSCCAGWVEHMKRSGFKVEVRNEDNLGPIKESVGIPVAMGSCHTAQIGRYFVEGHVPAEDVKRFLAEQPDAKGLTVPGMPAGSPGMELPSGKVQPYDVYIVAKDGTTSVYAHHGS